MKDPTFVVSKSAQPLLNFAQVFVRDQSQLGPKRAKIDKYIEICTMSENCLKSW